MKKEESTKATIIKAYLDKYGSDNKASLSRQLATDFPEVFKSAEMARSAIRYHTGNNGLSDTKKVLSSQYIEREALARYESIYNIPDTDALDYPVFKLPVAQNRILVISDLHVPYHDPRAIDATLTWAREHDINTVFINGDLVDLYQLSYFIRDRRRRDFPGERDMVLRVLDGIQAALPSAVMYIRSGNHEERLEIYLKTRAPELFGTPEFRFNVLFKLGERGITYINDRIRVMMGKLGVLHGHEYYAAPNIVNPARSIFLKAKESVLVSHHHQTSEHAEPTLSGDVIGTWSIACLCDLHPDWMPLNKWNHGFARVKTDENGNFNVTNLRIYYGKVL